MPNKFVSITALVFGSSAALAGCGLSSHPSASPHRVSHPKTVAAASLPKATKANSSPTYTTTPAVPPQSPVTSASASAHSVVREWAEASLYGRAPGVPYGDQQSYYSLEKVWGHGTNGTDANSLHYVIYGSEHAVVGFNEGVQLADVRSYNSNLNQITLSDIESVLGKPDAVSQSAGSVVYTYDRGQYRLLWVFSGSSSTVNHADVQWPKGMVAPMASETSPTSFSTTVRFTANGKHVQTASSTLTVQKGSTVTFVPGNASTSNLVKQDDLALYGAQFVHASVPTGQVPLSLADAIHGWSYKFPLDGTWRFAIVPSHTSATSVSTTLTINVTG